MSKNQLDPETVSDVVFGLYRPVSQRKDNSPEVVQEVILYVQNGLVLEFDATYENKLEAQKVYNEMRALKNSRHSEK